MDNFHLDVTASGKEMLTRTFALLSHHNVVGYRVFKKGDKRRNYAPDSDEGSANWEADTLILFWHPDTDVILFPTQMTPLETVDMVWLWLKKATPGPHPDIDGDTGAAFRVFCDFWGRVEGESSSIAAVQPEWAMYGK